MEIPLDLLKHRGEIPKFPVERSRNYYHLDPQESSREIGRRENRENLTEGDRMRVEGKQRQGQQPWDWVSLTVAVVAVIEGGMDEHSKA